MIPKRNILRNSFKAAYFNIIFQIFCRFITFGINAFIIRHVGRDILGIMNIRLLLLESTILFLSKEAINRSTLSSITSDDLKKPNKCSWPQIINQIWLTVPISLILMLPCIYIWLNLLAPVSTEIESQYKFACWSMAISCSLELCAEVPIFLAKINCLIKLTILMDTTRILIRSLVFLSLIFWDSKICIIAFGIAQFCSAVTIVIGYYLYFHYKIQKNYETKQKAVALSKKNDDLNSEDYSNNIDEIEIPFDSLSEFLPGVAKNSEVIFNRDLQYLTISFIKQSMLKQILTEGEKYVMSISPVLTFSEQAIYDTVNNIGSLAARFLFRPIEDSAYFYFTQTVSRDTALVNQDNKKIKEACFVLQILVKSMLSIGLIIFIFGQSYSEIVLYLYGGSNFIAGGLPEILLRWHCLTILFLGINGITEGYMLATNASHDIDKFNYFMAIFSVVFLILAYLLTSLFGPVGFILANCTNMLCRIYYSLKFIKKSFVNVCNPFNEIMPGKFFLISLCSLGVICKYFVNKNLHIIVNLLIGGTCFLLTIFCWLLENKRIIKFLISLRNKDK